jgi:hypothetical protein
MPIRLRCLLEELIDHLKPGVLWGFDRFANGSVQLSSVVQNTLAAYVGSLSIGFLPKFQER